MAADLFSFTNSSFTSLSTSHNHHSTSSHKPFKVTMSQNQSYWASINDEIEANLKQVIPIRPPLSVYEPMHHLVFTAPKSMAPALCIAACEVAGGKRDTAMTAASALHLMHAAMSTHELLLNSDRPAVPRRAFNSNIELLTGDAIMPYAYELLARQNSFTGGDNSGQILRVIVEITRAMGSQGMINGQYWLTRFSESNRSEALWGNGWIDHVCKKKEGELYACGAACGTILGGGSEEEIEKLRRFGLYVGIINGLKLHGTGREEKGLSKMVEDFRVLALNELKGFDEAKAEKVSSLINDVLGVSNLSYSNV